LCNRPVFLQASTYRRQGDSYPDTWPDWAKVRRPLAPKRGIATGNEVFALTKDSVLGAAVAGYEFAVQVRDGNGETYTLVEEASGTRAGLLLSVWQAKVAQFRDDRVSA
jgi:hypothetical protein